MDVKLPHLGEGADSGTVVNLFVKEGDQIEKDQAILELENEKAVAAIPSTAAGKVQTIHVKEGDKISVGQRLITLAPADGDAAPAETEGESKPEKRKAPSAIQPERPPEEEVEPEAGQPALEETAAHPGAAPAASPSLRKMARDLGIDLTRVRGSERGGRIVLADLRAYIQSLQKLAAPPKAAETKAAPAAEKIDFSKWGEIARKPMSSLRKVISRRMTENWQTVPHVTQFDEADVTALLELRKKFAPAYEAKGTRLTLTSFALKAAADTLKKHPIFNSSLDEAAAEIVLKEYFHLGIAVDTDAGLMVPVIRDVDKKNLVELSRELEELAKKARERKLSAEEMKGGTFTISNQGGIGGAHFTPIVNKPEVAILGLGRGVMRAIVKDKNIVPRTMLPLALSYDHRVIDGGSAARFMTDLVTALESFTEAQAKAGTE